MAHLGGAEIIARIHWKYNLRSILTSKDSGEPPGKFSQAPKYLISTEICTFTCPNEDKKKGFEFKKPFTA